MRLRTERLLQGLWCFPMVEGELSPEELNIHIRRKLHLSAGLPAESGSARHVFTHQVWQMRIFETDAEASASAPEGYEFIPLEKLNDLALPTAMNAALAALKR